MAFVCFFLRIDLEEFITPHSSFSVFPVLSVFSVVKFL